MIAGPTGPSSSRGESLRRHITAANATNYLDLAWVEYVGLNPAAGSHTYYLDAAWDSGGTTTLNGGTGNPAFIAIDAC